MLCDALLESVFSVGKGVAVGKGVGPHYLHSEDIAEFQ